MPPIKVYIKKQPTKPPNKIIQTISYMTLVAGIGMLFWSFYPIVSFEIYSHLFISRNAKSPVPHNQMADVPLNGLVLGNSDVRSDRLRDFISADQWFPEVSTGTSVRTFNVSQYSLSIPKINILNAEVEVGGDDLAVALVHYLPQSLPGEYGNVAIFGHSSLPQLYKADDYKTIFTYLPTLELGDNIIINVDRMKYEYEVIDMFVVDPDHISVLDQKTEASYLTLITCVPPGTYLRRLIVRAKLTELPVNTY